MSLGVNRSLFHCAFAAAFFLASIGLIFSGSGIFLPNAMVEISMLLMDAAPGIKSEICQSHFRLEEILSTDRKDDVNHRWYCLKTAPEKGFILKSPGGRITQAYPCHYDETLAPKLNPKGDTLRVFNPANYLLVLLLFLTVLADWQRMTHQESCRKATPNHDKGPERHAEQYTGKKAVAENEAGLQRIFHLAPIGIGMTEKNRFRQLNDHMQQMTGYSSKELIGQRSRILYINNDAFEQVEAEIFDQIRTKGRAAVETLWRRKDGTMINILYSSTPQDGNNLEKGLVFTALDITSWKQTAVRLKASEEKYRLLADNTVDCIWVMDLNLTFHYINPSVVHMLGYTVDEWIGSSLEDHFPPEEIQSMGKLIENELIKGAKSKGVVFETSIFKKNGELIPVEISGKILFDSAGQPIGLQGTTRDISRRKHAENEIKRLNEDLERRVIERTAQLKAANKELEAFAYSVSHDLRAPLRSIDGFSQAILEDYNDVLDQTGQDYLRRVLKNSKHMGELIEDMLKLSRVIRCEMIKTRVDLSATAHSIIEELETQEPQRQIAVTIQPNVFASGDAHLLRAVLTNLLGNAWKFTAKKKNSAQIEFGVRKDGGTSVFYVKDNGAGFDMAYSEKLFLAFQRLHSNAEFPGSGVGLATVARIIQRHGGRIWADGKPGQGAAFFFTL